MLPFLGLFLGCAVGKKLDYNEDSSSISVKMSNTTVNMQVPADMVDQLQEFLQNSRMLEEQEAAFGVGDVPRDDEGLESEENDVSRMCTVKRIVGHRKDQEGQFEFRVQWASDHSTEWVRDEDCTGPLLPAYLAKEGIKTAYLFCRVSTKDQAGDTSLSLQAQEASLRANVPVGFERVRTLSISKSAYVGIPKALREIGEAANSGDAIMVWRVDRLSRNIIHYLDWCEKLAERGVIIYSEEGNMTYNENRLTFIQAIVEAQKEAMVLGERVKAANREKRRRGDEHIGGLPYGKRYRRITNVDGRTERMVVVNDPAETDVINRIRRSKTPALIVGLLNDAGIRKRGRRWTKEMVARIRDKK